MMMFFFSPYVKSCDITRILKSCDISAVEIFKMLKDEVNNVFDTNSVRQIKTGHFISKAHVYLNS
jgi:hypothetical protein